MELWSREKFSVFLFILARIYNERTPRNVLEGDVINVVVYMAKPFPFHYEWVKKLLGSHFFNRSSTWFSFSFVKAIKNPNYSPAPLRVAKVKCAPMGSSTNFLLFSTFTRPLQMWKVFSAVFLLPCELKTAKKSIFLTVTKI